MYREINKCRICGNQNLISLLNIGNHSLTGIFPKRKINALTSGPLELVKCHPKNAYDKVCHLVQLHHSYDSSEMYGLNYGYRSGLNQSMVKHLQSIVKYILQIVQLKKDDLIIDIGSNDSTLLQQYPLEQGVILTGIDPTGIKFNKYYPAYIQLIPDFFSSKKINDKFPEKKAKVITSIAMFYDLEEPLSFVQQIYDTLTDDGIWVFEQSYLPAMLKTNSYDTICHEHLEYYTLKQITHMFDKISFKIIDIVLNDVNGGSFRVTAAKKDSHYGISPSVSNHIAFEKKMKLDSITPYVEFKNNVEKHKEDLLILLQKIKNEGKKVFGYGASTKGNVLLQYCGLTTSDIPFIAEVNEDKFGSYTPFTHIPIISEKEARSMNPDYFLVLPWHFRKEFLEKEKAFLQSGGKFIFPLPNIEIIGQ